MLNKISNIDDLVRNRVMIIQIFTVQYFVYDLLGQNPINIIRLAGVFLIIGGIFSLFVSQPKSIKI